MLTATQFRNLAMDASNDAAEYREQSAVSSTDRSDRLLRYAVNREADSEFYRSRAEILEGRNING